VSGANNMLSLVAHESDRDGCLQRYRRREVATLCRKPSWCDPPLRCHPSHLVQGSSLMRI
jgi:hypothetical protein